MAIKEVVGSLISVVSGEICFGKRRMVRMFKVDASVIDVDSLLWTKAQFTFTLYRGIDPPL